MKTKLIVALLLTLLTSPLLAQEERFSQEVMQRRNVSVQQYVKSSSRWDWQKIKEDGGLIHPNNEFKAAVDFLYHQDPETRPFIKFFTTYAVPHELREQTVLTLSYVVHSLIAWGDDFVPTFRPLAIKTGNRFVPYQLVPGSQTLWWIDIRDYGWDNNAFEQVVLNDGYFVIPIIDERLAFLLDAEGLSPNILLRADWFVVNAFDNQRQVDRGLDTITDILLYSRLNRAPLNLDELEDLWAVDNGVEYRSLVTKSQAVSRHNRVVQAEQGRFKGPFMYTNDVIFQEGARDYLEDFFNFEDGEPRVVDAGEVFWHNQLGMLVYDLFNQKEDRVTFGDPTVVRHPGDIVGDVRVRVAHSCADCHSRGPIEAENTLTDLLKAGVKIRVPEFDDKADIEATYIGDGFNVKVKEGQSLYAAAMHRINGLSPEQNGINYLSIVSWYSAPVSLEQAAIEVAVTPDFLRSRLVGKTSGRLAILVKGDEPMPRDLWESVGFDGVPGGFQHAMVLVYGLFFKDINLKIKEEDFLQHRVYDWESKFDVSRDINLFLKKKESVEIKPQRRTTLSYEDLQRKADYISQEIDRLEAKLKQKTNVAYLSKGVEVYAYSPGVNTSEVGPKYRLIGPNTYPVYHNTDKTWVGIVLNNKEKEKVFVLRTQVSIKQE